MSTRDDLVAAGVVLLERDGLSGLSLRAIAAEVGVSHGAPRRHFPTYGALLAAIARRGVEDLDALLTPTLDSNDPRAGLAQASRAYVDFAQARPEMFTLMFRHDLLEGRGGNLRETTARWFTRVAELVEQITGDRDPHRAAALWAGVHGVAVIHARRANEPVTTGALDSDSTIDVLVVSLLPG